MKQLPWFRLYHEARNDAKLRLLSDAEHRVWFHLLCYAAEQHDGRGTITLVDRFLLAAETARGDEDLLDQTITKLIKLMILAQNEDGSLSFISFSRRQYDKPSDMPEATRKRQQKRRDKGDSNGDGSNVTPTSRDVTPSHAQEEKRGDIEEEKSKSAQPSAPAVPSAREANTNENAAALTKPALPSEIPPEGLGALMQPPTLDEAVTHGTKCGIDARHVKLWHAKRMRIGWIDGFKRPIQDWRMDLRASWIEESNKREEKKSNAKPRGSYGARVEQQQQPYDRDKVRRLLGAGGSTPTENVEEHPPRGSPVESATPR